MASRWWNKQNASANWDVTGPTNWGSATNTADGASVPGTNDDVFFDGVGGGLNNSTLNVGFTIKSLNMTGFANTLTHSASVTLTISGNGVTFKLAGTYNLGDTITSALLFTGTSGTTLITSSGKTVGGVTFNGAGGGWQLADALSTSATVTLTAGTLDANNKNITMLKFASSNSNTRSILFGSGTWTLTSASATTIWDTSTSTNLSTTPSTGVIKCTGASANAQTVTGGSVTLASLWFSAGTHTHTLTNVVCNNLDFTGFTGTWGIASNNITINGSVTLVAGMTESAGVTWTFAATSGTKTITTAGKTLSNLTNIVLNGVGGTWQLAGALALNTGGGSVPGITLTNGTFDANNQNVTSWAFSSSNSNTRVLTMGSGTWSLLGNGSVWDTSTSTGLTINANTSTVDITGANAGSRTLSMNGVAINALQISASVGPGVTFTNVSCNNLTFTSAYTGVWAGSTTCTIAGTLLLVTQQGTPTYSGTLTFTATSSKNITTAAKSLVCGFEFNGVSGTWVLQDALTTTGTATLTNGTWNTNAKAVSIGSFASSNTNTRVLTLTSTTLTVTGTGTVWDTTTTTGLTFTTTSSSVLFNASSQTISPGGKVFATCNFNNATPAVTISSNFTATACTITGSGTVTMSGAANWDVTTFTPNTSLVKWTGSSTATVTSNGQSFNSLECAKAAATTLQLVDALSITGASTLTLTSGTFDAANQNISTPNFVSSNRNTRSLLMGSGTWTITGTGLVWDCLDATNMTTTPSTSAIKLTDASATGKTFEGGYLEYHNLWLTGAGTGSFIIGGGNKWADFKVDTPPHTVKFKPGSVQRVATWTVNGTAGNLQTMKSVTDGEPWGLYLIGGGAATSDYASVRDSRAS